LLPAATAILAGAPAQDPAPAREPAASRHSMQVGAELPVEWEMAAEKVLGLGLTSPAQAEVVWGWPGRL